MTKRYAIALRLSTEDEDKKAGEVGSLETQRRRTTAYVENVGGTVVAEYEEDGVSGALEYLNRSAVDAMLRDAEAGLLDAVVWDKADRQGRSTTEVLLIEQDLGRFGVEVHLVESGLRQRGTSDGYFMEGARDLFAATERIRIKERMADGRLRKAEAGKWIGGAPPFGYAIAADGRLEAHPGEAAVVERMFDAVASGLSAREAAQVVSKEFGHLRKDGTLPKRRGGQGWGNQHVYAAMKREAYYGAGFVRSVKAHPANPATEVIIPAPAIVSEELFTKAKKALAARRLSTKHKTAAEFETHAYGFAKRVAHVHPDGTEFSMYGITRSRSNTKGETWKERCYRCVASVPRRGRFDDADPNRCGGFGVTPKGHRRTSVFADKMEAAFIVEMMEKLQDRETFEKWLRFEDAKAVSDAAKSGFVSTTPEDIIAEADARLAELDDQADRAERLYLKTGKSEDWLDEQLAEVDRERAKLAAVKQRAAEDLHRAELREFTVEALLGKSIGYGFETVGQEREAFRSEDGSEVVEVPGWTDVARDLMRAAEAVLSGSTRELAEWAVEWVARLAEVFDVRLRVFDIGEKLPRIEASGSVDLGAIGETLPDFRRNTGAASRIPFAVELGRAAA